MLYVSIRGGLHICHLLSNYGYARKIIFDAMEYPSAFDC